MNTKDFIRLGIPLGEATRRASHFVSKSTISGFAPTNVSAPIFLPRALGPAGFDTAKMAIALRYLLMPSFIINRPSH